MGKFTLLLHDTTLINFPTLWKLLKRYRYISILIPFISFSCITIYFLLLPDLYSISIGLKNIGQQSNNNLSSVVSVLGEKSSELSAAEVVGIVDTLDFKRKLAKQIYENNNFKNLVFGSIKLSKKKTSVEIIDECNGSEDCIIEAISDVIGDYYEIIADKNIDSRFYLNIKSFSENTTITILNILVELVVKERSDAIMHRVSEQIRMTTELIVQKRVELREVNLDSLVEQQSLLLKKIDESERRMKEYSILYNDQKIKLSEVEIRLDQTDLAISDNMSADRQEIFKKVFNLSNKVDQLQQDIQIMEISSDKKSDTDQMVIAELKDELRQKKQELAMIPDLSSYLKNVEKFIQATDAKSASDKFNYKVMKKQFDKIKLEYESAIKLNQELISQRIKLDGQIDKLKPSFEYLKLLEAKAVQLKLLEATIIADVAFDKYHSKLQLFKRTSLIKLLIFASLLSLLLMVCAVIVRYLVDDRIFDEDELKTMLGDVEIIGQTPRFD